MSSGSICTSKRIRTPTHTLTEWHAHRLHHTGMAGREGVEPSQTESESVVLPTTPSPIGCPHKESNLVFSGLKVPCSPILLRGHKSSASGIRTPVNQIESLGTCPLVERTKHLRATSAYIPPRAYNQRFLIGSRSTGAFRYSIHPQRHMSVTIRPPQLDKLSCSPLTLMRRVPIRLTCAHVNVTEGCRATVRFEPPVLAAAPASGGSISRSTLMEPGVGVKPTYVRFAIVGINRHAHLASSPFHSLGN